MKRCYLGAALLAALLLLGIFSSRWLENGYAELEKQMRSAAREEDPAQLLALTEEIRGRWEGKRAVTAVLADHQYLERIEEAFCLLTWAAERRDGAQCARLCLEIAQVFGVLSEEQQLKWENLL